MLKKKIVIELSKKSLDEAIRKVKEYQESLDKGLNNGVKAATEAMYNKILTNCYDNRLGEYVNNIQWEYDATTNTGRVWTNEMIVILNEFGTGIKGVQDEYASKHGYTVNLSGKGERGWAFPTKDGEYRWTHGIKSKHMFFDAYQDMKNEFGNYINMEIKGTLEKFY